MKSEFKKLDRDVLLEWNYDSSNLILEPYKILSNSKDLINSYMSSDSSITNNTQDYQLFSIDSSINKYAKVDINKYNFLSVNQYVSPVSIRHDKLKIYFPSNYIFGEYQGIYLRLYTYNYRNNKFFDISNFFFDATDSTSSNILQTFTSPLLYQDKTWNKFIELNVPSVYSIALQREDGYTQPGSLNHYLTNGDGLSQTSPIFIDFRFITKITQIGSVKSYLTTQKNTLQVPQTPQLEALGIYIQESTNGDYFEINATYNNNFEEFVEFIDSSLRIGKYYYLEFLVTIFEENIKGKSLTYRVENDFTEIIEYRPIIKYSTTKSIIDVEMKLINKSDGNIVIRKGAYGMTPDQLSKYLINRKKINIRNAFKPKIYSKNQFSKYHIDQLGKSPTPENSIEVPVPELLPLSNYKRISSPKDGAESNSIASYYSVSCYSSQALNKVYKDKIQNYHYVGGLKIGIKPFDNIYKFMIAYRYSNDKQLEPLDLTNCNDLKLVFKNSETVVEFTQYFSNETVAKLGMCQFRVNENKFQDLKKIYKSGNTIFYIITTNQGITNVIYTGLYTILDTATSLGDGNLSDIIGNIDTGILVGSGNVDAEIIEPPKEQEIAIVTRKRVTISNESKNPIKKDGLSGFSKNTFKK
jgi:hypothetical protein